MLSYSEQFNGTKEIEREEEGERSQSGRDRSEIGRKGKQKGEKKRQK